eukprot:7198494-Alexandrium_andersonii.AAC.1
MSASLVGSEMCIRDSRALLRCWSAREARHTWSAGGRAEWHSPWAGWLSLIHILTLPTICSV